MRSWLDLFESQRSERRAVRYGHQWYTYGMLASRARRLAAFLSQQGIGVGDAVGILAYNHIAHIDLIAACDLLGAAYAPLNFRLSEPEQSRTLEALNPALVFVDADNSGKLPRSGPRAIALADYERLLGKQRDAQPPADIRDGERVAMLLLTGGSTGTPKAAMIPRRQIAANNANTVAGWALTGDDCVIQASPAFHAGINVLATPLLSIGGRVVLQDSFASSSYLAAAAEHRATVLFLVPTMYQMLIDDTDFAETDLSSVRFAISGGAACPATIRHAYADKDVPFRQGYGLTEVGPNCFSLIPEKAKEKAGTVGFPVMHCQAKLVDDAGNEVTEPGAVGELLLKGPHVCAGYWENEEATNAAYKDGWWATGDYFSRDEDGYYSVVGRKKEMFISGGENVYPAEVEQVILSHPKVSECAVVGVPDERWGEVGFAYVAPAAITPTELEEFLQGKIARYKQPKRVITMDALPRNAMGKVVRAMLPTMAAV